MEDEHDGPPREFLAFVERYRMKHESDAHAIKDLLDSLDEEQLIAFRTILQACLMNTIEIPFFIGAIQAILHSKYNICLGCGKNHDDMLNDMKGPEQPEEMPSPTLKDLNLELDLHGVTCKNCGQPYRSIEDRALLKDCPGCIQKTKWG